MKHEHRWPQLPNSGVLGAVYEVTESNRVTFYVCNDCHSVKIIHQPVAGVAKETIVEDPFLRRPPPLDPLDRFPDKGDALLEIP